LINTTADEAVFVFVLRFGFENLSRKNQNKRGCTMLGPQETLLCLQDTLGITLSIVVHLSWEQSGKVWPALFEFNLDGGSEVVGCCHNGSTTKSGATLTISADELRIRHQDSCQTLVLVPEGDRWVLKSQSGAVCTYQIVRVFMWE